MFLESYFEMIERIVFKYEEIIENPLYTGFCHCLGRWFRDDIDTGFKELLMELLVKIGIPCFFPICPGFECEEIFEEIEWKFDSEEKELQYGRPIEDGTLFWDGMKFNKNPHFVIDDIEIFETPEYIEYEICRICWVDFEWKKPVILKEYLTDNRSIEMIVPHAFRISYNLKIIECCVKFWLKCMISGWSGCERIKKLPLGIIEPEYYTMSFKRLPDIIEKRLKYLLPFRESVVEFDEVRMHVIHGLQTSCT